MSRKTRTEYVAVWALGAAWMAFCFWAFGWAYSHSFFAYNRHSRLPVFAAALVGAGGIFVSAAAQWRAQRHILATCLRHAVGVALALCPLVAVSGLLHRAPHPWRPSADDAMGTGIDFLLLVGAGIASLLLLAGAVTMRRLLRLRHGPSKGDAPSGR
jgi:hypothetical protein